MRIQLSIRAAVVALTSLGLLIPQTSYAGTPARNQSAPSPQPTAQAGMVHDVTLGVGGVFRGQVLDTAGAPLVGVPVLLWRQQQQVAASTTDSNGQFEISGLGGGVYRVETPSGQANYRL